MTHEDSRLIIIIKDYPRSQYTKSVCDTEDRGDQVPGRTTSPRPTRSHVTDDGAQKDASNQEIPLSVSISSASLSLAPKSRRIFLCDRSL